jgi:3-methyl-2-oxobutanoate hydroxymethyltransferase
MTVYSHQVLQLLTLPELIEMKQRAEPIACLTAYDASFSRMMDLAGIDLILVGDSLGMVIQGQTTTVPVQIDEMVYHTRCVVRGRKRAFVIADLPFLTYTNPQIALDNARQLLQVGGAQMVKLEGARIEVIQSLVEFGIPVCAHLGLLPQSINQLGRYKVQGSNQQDADKIRQDARRIELAGAGMLILECVPSALAAEISNELTIPVIGIGAGASCDGQVLVIYDLLGIGTPPKFCKNFLQDSASLQEAIENYRQAVKQREFPSTEHIYR